MSNLRHSRKFKNGNTVVKIKNVKIGDGYFAIAAGPCSVENQTQYYETAIAAKKAGANIIRGSVFKPRTSPYSFQGLGRNGLKLIRDLGEDLDIVTMTEVMDTRDVCITADNSDILWIGARNMQNFSLLKEASKIENPVALKRGLSATLEEWLYAAEYLMIDGKENIILCERGIRTFEPLTRNSLDLSVIPLLRKKTHLPIIVDPSHATGNPDLIIPISKAVIAVNADGLLIEVHNNPSESLSDAKQALTPLQFQDLMNQINPYIEIEQMEVTR
ncbi:MAG: 3-deoxy-7-phosphoheptulonate synthase [Candidatus Hodarchaeales archaeon]|jgi:3-deoxy-7-phosphoheptulonate synthase